MPAPAQRRPLARTAALLLTASAAASGALVAPAPAQASGCRPTPALLSRPAASVRLAGGATARIWDTGPTPRNPQASVRLVAVAVPGLGRARVVAASHLTQSRTPSAFEAVSGAPAVLVNGGVFDPARGALPVLPQMVAGVVTKARAVPDPAITVAPDGQSSPDHLWLVGTASARGRSIPVTGLNWQSLTGAGINVYTPAWGSPKHPSGGVDVVLTAGRVSSVRLGASRGLAPRPGQIVLTAAGASGSWLAHLPVGTPVALAYRAATDAKHPVRDAIGRGARYMLHGVVQGGGCSARDELLRPRTAIGWTRAGTLIVVTVSGRADIRGVRFGGATIHQMADYMKRLGCYEATALDGGGSTTLLGRTPQGQVLRLDRSMREAQRPVPNVFAAG